MQSLHKLATPGKTLDGAAPRKSDAGLGHEDGATQMGRQALPAYRSNNNSILSTTEIVHMGANLDTSLM